MRYILFILFTLVCIISFAQEETTPAQTNSSSQARDRLVFAFNFDNLFHKETNGFQTRWHSRGIGIYFMYDMPINNSKVSFAPGLGFVHASYYTNSTVVEDSVGTHFSVIPDFSDNDNYKRSKLAVNYFEIPLELRFFSKENSRGNHWKAALGFKAGVKLNASAKEVRKENGTFKKIKTKGYPDVSLFRAGPTFRIGYGAFNLNMFYSITDLFKKDKGPEMTPFSIGISITTL